MATTEPHVAPARRLRSLGLLIALLLGGCTSGASRPATNDAIELDQTHQPPMATANVFSPASVRALKPSTRIPNIDDPGGLSNDPGGGIVDPGDDDPKATAFSVDRTTASATEGFTVTWAVSGRTSDSLFIEIAKVQMPGKIVDEVKPNDAPASTLFRRLTGSQGVEHFNLIGLEHRLSLKFGAHFDSSRTLAYLYVGANPCPAGKKATGNCSIAAIPALDYKVERTTRGYLFSDEPSGEELQSLLSNQRRVTFDSCGSVGGYKGRIEAYSWRAQKRGTPPLPVLDTPTKQDCRASMVVNGLGWWDVHVRLSISDGSLSDFKYRLNIRDILIVSVGDSAASGEGNPDVNGSFWDGNPTTSDVPAQWEDESCHRSRQSFHTRAAVVIDNNDPRSTVSYWNIACSGATVSHLVDREQSSFGHGPQLRFLRDKLCHAGCSRKIDVLLISAGINDLGISTVIKGCAAAGLRANYPHLVGAIEKVWGSFPNCTDALESATDAASGIGTRLIEMAAAIRQFNLWVGTAIVSQYPVKAITDGNGKEGGCNTLRSISRSMAHTAHLAGVRMNTGIVDAVRYLQAHPLKNVDDWRVITGAVETFDGHGYCASGSSSWFVGLVQSMQHQNDPNGTMHPNATGHAKLAALINEQFQVEAERDPARPSPGDLVCCDDMTKTDTKGVANG